MDSEEEAMKTLRKKKSFLERESEIVMQALLASSSNDTDSGKENHSLDPVILYLDPSISVWNSMPEKYTKLISPFALSGRE